MNITTWKNVCYSVTNKYYFINFSIYPILKYSGLSFIQVGAEKQYLHTYNIYV